MDAATIIGMLEGTRFLRSAIRLRVEGTLLGARIRTHIAPDMILMPLTEVLGMSVTYLLVAVLICAA